MWEPSRASELYFAVPQRVHVVPTVNASRVKEARHEARGAARDGKGTNFSIFSAHASRVEVCLFDTAGPHLWSTRIDPLT